MAKKMNYFTALAEIQQWTTDDVANCLHQNGLSDCIEVFIQRGIDGSKFLELTYVMMIAWKKELKNDKAVSVSELVAKVKSDPHLYCNYASSPSEGKPSLKPAGEVPRTGVVVPNIGTKSRRPVPDLPQSTTVGYKQLKHTNSSQSNVGEHNNSKPRWRPPDKLHPKNVTSNIGSNDWNQQNQSNFIESPSNIFRPRLPPPSEANFDNNANAPSIVFGRNQQNITEQPNFASRPPLPSPHSETEVNFASRPPLPPPSSDTQSNFASRNQLPPAPPSETELNFASRPPLPPPSSETESKFSSRPPLPPPPSETESNFASKPPLPPPPSETESNFASKPPLPPPPSDTQSNFSSKPPLPPPPSETESSGSNQFLHHQQTTDESNIGSSNRPRLPAPPQDLSSFPNSSTNQLGRTNMEDLQNIGSRPRPLQTSEGLPPPRRHFQTSMDEPLSEPKWSQHEVPRRNSERDIGSSEEDNESWGTDWGEHDDIENIASDSEISDNSRTKTTRHSFDEVNRNDDEDIDLYENFETEQTVTNYERQPVPPPGPKPSVNKVLESSLFNILKNKNVPSSSKGTNSNFPVPNLPHPPTQGVTKNIFQSIAAIPLPSEQSDDDYESVDINSSLQAEIKEQLQKTLTPPAHVKPLPRVPATHPGTGQRPLPVPNPNKRRVISLEVNSMSKAPPSLSRERPLDRQKLPLPDDDEANEYESILEPTASDDYYLQPISKEDAPPVALPPRFNTSLSTTPTRKAFNESTKSLHELTQPSSPSSLRTLLFSTLPSKLKKPAVPDPSSSSGSAPQRTRNTLPVPEQQSNPHLLPLRNNPPIGLQSEPWYHVMDRNEAKDALKACGENGCFMIRPSHTTNPFTLSLLYEGQAYHIGVRKRPDGQYALGSEKYNEQTFPSVESLVEYYKREHLVLSSNGIRSGRTLLTSTIPRDNPRLS